MASDAPARNSDRISDVEFQAVPEMARAQNQCDEYGEASDPQRRHSSRLGHWSEANRASRSAQRAATSFLGPAERASRG